MAASRAGLAGEPGTARASGETADPAHCAGGPGDLNAAGAPGASGGGPAATSDATCDAQSLRYRGTAYRATLGAPVVPPHPSRVDLHTHSNRSDGVLEPATLVAAVAAAGVRTMALTDHDTLAGARELLAAPELLPLELIAGVEINSIARGVDGLWEGELHILGLGVDPGDDAFESTLKHQRAQRRIRFKSMVRRLRELGFPVDVQAEALLAAMDSDPELSLGRPQVARTLVAAGHAISVDDAMQRLLARGRPAYVPREGLGPVQAIAAIRAARGLPVLAHFADADARIDVVTELKDAGLGGLEVHYRHFDAATVESLAAVARTLGLVPTGGSDYHGDGEAYAAAHARLYVPDEDAASLMAALVSQATAPLAHDGMRRAGLRPGDPSL